MESNLERLYKAVSAEGFDIGTYEEFSNKMQTTEQRKSFYDVVLQNGLDLGDYNEYEKRLGKPNEVSSQGSEVTSETLSEPLQPSQNTKDLEQLTPDQVMVSEATPEDYELAEQGLRRVLVDIPVVESDGTDQTRKGEFVIPEYALTLEPTLTEVETDGKVDYVLKYTDEDGIEQIVSERAPEVVTDKGVGSDLLNSLYSGLAQVNSMLADIPELLYNIASVPQNLLADAIENNAGEGSAQWLRPNYSDVSQGEYNPLQVLSRYSNQQRQASEEFNAEVTEFENDIIGSLGAGNYSDAGRQVANAITQSAPSMLLMAMTSGAGASAGLGTVGRSTITAIPFASGAYQETDESTPENVRVLYSLAKGFNEVIFEESFGTLPILQQIGSKVLNKSATKEIVEGYMRTALSKNGIPASIMKGALSEMATELSNDIVDVYGLGTKDAIDWRNIVNAGVVGSVVDGSLSTLNSAIPDRSKRQRATELQSQITAVMQDMDNTTSDVQVQVLENTLDSKVSELDSIVEESVDLPNPVKDQLIEITSQEEEIELMLQSDNVSEESKAAIQEQLVDLDNQKQQILENATKNEEGVSSEVREGQEPVQTELDQEASQETAETDRVLQTQEEEINPEQPSLEQIAEDINKEDSTPSYIEKTEGGRNYITKENIESNFPVFYERVIGKFGNSAWDSESIRDAISYLVSQKPTYAKGMENLIDSLIEAETLLSQLGQPADGITKQDLITKIQNNNNYTSKQKEVLIGITKRLKGTLFFDFTENSIEGSPNGYSFSENLLTAEEPSAFVHEVGHWGFYNVLSPEQRVEFLEYVKKRFYGTNRRMSDEVALGDNTFKDGSQYISNSTANFSEYFAEQFRQYVFSGQTDSSIKSLFETLKQYLQEVVAFFRDKSYNPDLKSFFDTIIEESNVKQEEIVEQVATETFFDTLTDTEARANRISELESRLRQSIEEGGKLRISEDPKQKAKRDLEFLRDLTEYAILKIADGTVKTAEAFSNLAKGIGDFGEDVINRAYYNAQEVAQQYIDTNPDRASISKVQGEVLTRMQDVTVDRTPATSKVTSKDVRRLTEGKIQGKITLTNKQALAVQMRTLNRGARDMAKNVREIGQTLKDYVKENKKRFSRQKFTSSEYASLARMLAGVTNETQMGKVIDIVDRALENADFRSKIDRVKTNQRTVKRKPFPPNLKKAVRDFANINPRDLGETELIEEYLGMLESLNKAGIKPTDVSIEAMQRLMSIADRNKELNAEAKEAERLEREEKEGDKIREDKVKKLEKELSDLGMTQEEISIISSDLPIEEVITKLSEKIAEIKPTRLDVIKDTSKKLLSDIKENLEVITEGMTKSDVRALREFLDNLDLELIADKFFLPLNYVLNNILNNSSINGMGNFLAMSISANKIANKTLMDKALGNFRKVAEKSDFWRKRLLGTLYTRTEAIVKNVREIGAIQEFFGFSDYDANSVSVKNKLFNIKKDIHKIIKKYNNKQRGYWRNPYNSTLAGAYAILAQRRKGWSPEEVQQNFSDRLHAMVESLDRLRNNRDKFKTKAYDSAIKSLQEVLNDLVEVNRNSDGSIESVTPKMTLQEIWTKLPEGYREYYNYTRDFFEANKEEFFTVTRMFSKEDVETDWENYYPMSYIDFTKGEGTRSKSRGSIDFTEAITGGNFRGTTSPTSGAGISRTVKGKMLPKDKILNFDLLGNFEVEAGRVLDDIGTLKDRWVMNMTTDIRNNGIAESTDYEGIASALSYRDILADRVFNDQDLINRGVTEDESLFRVVLDTLKTFGILRTLGGSSQFIKQSTPIFEVLGRVKNPASVALALKLYSPSNSELRERLLKHADTSLRANQESLFSVKKDTASLNKEVEKSLRGLAKNIGIGYRDLLNRAGKVTLYPLIKTDKVVADIGWLALYIDRVSADGKFDPEADVSQDAVAYANNVNSVVMNATDPSMQGDYSKSVFKMIQPMMGFSLNSMHNLVISASKLKDAIAQGDLADITRYSKEIVGNTANAVLFVVLSWWIRDTGMEAGKFIVDQIVKLTEDDEEREKELLEFVEEEFGNRRVANNARTINYAINDAITRGILSDATTPLIGAMTDALGIQEMIFGKEELKKANYSYAPYTSSHPNPFVNAVEKYVPVTGVVGMGVSSYITIGDNIASVFETQEDFIKKRHAIANADGTDIVVDEGYFTEEGLSAYGMPKYLEYSNYLAGFMGMVSLTGLSSQMVNTMVRNTKTAVRKMVEQDRGKGKTGDWEKRLKEEVTSFDSYTILGEKVKLTPEEMRKYSGRYLEEVVKVRERLGENIDTKLTVSEIEGLISDAARGVVESQIIVDNVNDLDTHIDKKLAREESARLLRASSIKIQKLKRVK